MQSYLTIRWLADRAYRADAFALYAWFRWLDDTVDERLTGEPERLAFVDRQRRILTDAAGGGVPADVSPEEALLVRLARPRRAGPSGPATSAPGAAAGGILLSLTSMLDVMEFDARRRGRRVTQGALDAYTHDLAVAVTEALHHCIGHGGRCPDDASRYVAVTGAHVAHMLRDLAEDVAAGYLNVPVDVVADAPGSLDDLHTPELRAWVQDRVAVARSCFATGRTYLAQVENPRCRLAGHAYVARFEWVLDAIERDGYRVRPGYPERATLRGGLAIAADGARSALAGRRTRSQLVPAPAAREEAR
jgi:phytoene/squalene synthetase